MDNDQVTFSKSSLENPLNLSMPPKEAKTLIEELISINTPYNKFKYNSVIYSVGDCLFIKDSNDSFSIGELVKIIPANGIKRLSFWPTIRVKWYYKKSELNLNKNGISPAFYEAISDYEVFKSNHYDTIFIETVLGKCTVLSIQDYQEQEENSDLIYFTRARYDPSTETITPSIDQWEMITCCNAPLNPDLMYIKCDQCDKWVHPPCEGLTNEEASTVNSFYCSKCTQANQSSSKGN